VPLRLERLTKGIETCFEISKRLARDLGDESRFVRAGEFEDETFVHENQAMN